MNGLRRDRSRALALARRSVEGLALVWVFVLLVVFAWRLAFPLELEWMEGGMLHQAHRLQHGQSPFPPPGPEYVPFLYTPLYSVVLAVLGFVLPLGFVLGRLVSILAWAATAAALWTAVIGEGKPRAHAATAVGLYCAGYVFAFRWYDLARPDMLFIALVTWGLVLLRHSGPRPSRAIWAGVLVALAFWTKQTAASFVLASGLGALLVSWRRLPLYAGTIALIDGGGVLLGNALTDGWLWTYIYELHQTHTFNRERFTTKTWGMFAHAWPAVMLVLLGMLSAGLGRLPARIRRWRAQSRPPESSATASRVSSAEPESADSSASSSDADETSSSDIDVAAARDDEQAGDREDGGEEKADEPEPNAEPPTDPVRGLRALGYWTLMAIAGLLVSALGYATQWAEPNAFIPGVVLGALALAVALPVGGRGELLALVLLSVQLTLCLLTEPLYQPVQTKGRAGLGQSYAWQDPWRTLPDADAWDRAAALREQIEGSDAELLALHRPWWSILAGGSGHVGSMGITDVRDEERAAIEAAIRESVTERRYAQIWIEGEPPRWLSRVLLRNYRVDRRLHGDQRVRPLSGYMSEAGMVTPYRRDQLLLVPKGPRPRPANTEVIADFESGRLDGFTPEGPAFRRPLRRFPGKIPVAGPYGGDYLLSSLGPRGQLQLMGHALSPVLTLPAQGRVELLVGFVGRRPRGLSVWLQEEGGGGRTVRLTIPPSPHSLSPVRWEITPDWIGAQIRVRLGDETPEAALYIDDLWVVGAAG